MSRAARRRRKDDHLSLVAWIRRDQVVRFEKAGIETVAELAAAPDAARPYAMEVQTFRRLRKQAALQVAQRTTGTPAYELLPPREWFGFSLMPEPDPGDVFFDMEGDPFYEIGTGLEYLFGVSPAGDGAYRAFWGKDRAQERLAFEQFVDWIVAHREQHPAAHIYHYATYERTALRQLAQRHATREEEIDQLLRAEAFVDLFAVVRQALMVSEEKYSIKRLEPFYGFERKAHVRRGDDSVVQFEEWLLSGDGTILDAIEHYNEEDCRSTYALREWLLTLRLEAERKFGRPIPLRKLKRAGEPCHPQFVEGCAKCVARERDARELQKTTETQQQLLAGIPMPVSAKALAAMPDALRARFLLGHALAYHRREAKPVFWEFFDRCGNADRLVEFDKDCLGGLEFCADIEPFTVGKEKNKRFTYRFPDQIYDVGDGTLFTPEDQARSVGTVVSIDEERGLVVVKLSGAFQGKPQAVTALVPLSHVEPGPQKSALRGIGEAWLRGEVPDRSALADLLLSRPPRLVGRAVGAKIQPDTVDEASLLAVIEALDASVLFVQGPPGTGKSTKAGGVIAQLLRDGKRVGVMSNSHKAIHNLNRCIEAAAARLRIAFKGAHKASSSNSGSAYESSHGFIVSIENGKAVDEGAFQLISGNAWHHAREECVETLDYLFIDEAGQVSLADAIAVAPCAKNLVVIGDPLQLAQVSQGIHPPGVGVSVLAHILGDARTVPENRGIFLDVTYRLHPAICAFVSELIYDGRLKPGPHTANQRIGMEAGWEQGLSYDALEHAGNTRESEEEAREVVRLAESLLGSTVVDEHGGQRPAQPGDVIVVAPYNAQRRLIHRLLNEAGHPDIRVGTVDKFQGQEAYAVLYSMATSSAEDAPRGLEFLLDRNRFNVAISRARALAVLVCSRGIVESRPKDIDGMRALSLLCRYAEEAATINTAGRLHEHDAVTSENR